MPSPLLLALRRGRKRSPGADEDATDSVDEDAPAVSMYGQTLEQAGSDAPADAPWAAQIAVPAPASSRMPPSGQLPSTGQQNVGARRPEMYIPSASSNAFVTSSTPSTPVEDLDALLSEVKEQSDGTYCH